jgi:putative membrane protein
MSLRTLLSQADLDCLNKSLSAARERTGVRIIPIITQSSGKYELAEDMVGLWATAIALALVFLFFTNLPLHPSAGEVRADGRGILSIFVVIVLGFSAGALLATQIGFLRRLFVPRKEQVSNVDRRASQAFQEERLRSQDNPSVLVLYVSMFERAVRVLADESVKTKLAPQDIEAIRRIIYDALQARRLRAGLQGAIGHAVDLAACHFPPKSNDLQQHIDRAQLAIIR